MAGWLAVYMVCVRKTFFLWPTPNRYRSVCAVCCVRYKCAPRAIFNPKQTASARNKWEQHKQWQSIDTFQPQQTTSSRQQKTKCDCRIDTVQRNGYVCIYLTLHNFHVMYKCLIANNLTHFAHISLWLFRSSYTQFVWIGLVVVVLFVCQPSQMYRMNG